MASENPIDDNPPGSQTKQDANDENTGIQPATPPAVRLEVKPPPSHSCHKITCENACDGWDYTKLIAEFLGLGFLIAYTIFAGQQVCQMRKANRISKDQFRVDQRPYVWLLTDHMVDLPPVIVAAGDHKGQIGAAFHYSNYGRSPALEVRSDAHIAIWRQGMLRTERRGCY